MNKVTRLVLVGLLGVVCLASVAAASVRIPDPYYWLDRQNGKIWVDAHGVVSVAMSWIDQDIIDDDVVWQMLEKLVKLANLPPSKRRAYARSIVVPMRNSEFRDAMATRLLAVRLKCGIEKIHSNTTGTRKYRYRIVKIVLEPVGADTSYPYLDYFPDIAGGRFGDESICDD